MWKRPDVLSAMSTYRWHSARSPQSASRLHLPELSLSKRRCAVKMISAQHSSNNGKNWVINKPSLHGNNLDKGKKILSRFKLTSLTPRDLLELEVLHISIKTSSRFALVENTITHAWSILTRFDIKFLENAWDVIAGSPGEMNYSEVSKD